MEFLKKRLLFWVAMSLTVVASAEMNDVLQAEHRTAGFSVRDVYRHPIETLTFFDVQPHMMVVEVWPGLGWYTEILAAYMSAGEFYAAHFPAGVGVFFYDKYRTLFEEKMAADKVVYDAVKIAIFDPKRSVLTVPDGSADRVLTFRNVHNWLSSDSEAAAFMLFYRALKPGGLLGVVEHRAKPGTDWETMKESGYMTEAYVIELAEQAGFVLEGRSDINANPADTTDHPEGVWSLPPTLRLGEQDRDQYVVIGESDRMTLKFRKPAALLNDSPE